MNTISFFKCLVSIYFLMLTRKNAASFPFTFRKLVQITRFFFLLLFYYNYKKMLLTDVHSCSELPISAKPHLNHNNFESIILVWWSLSWNNIGISFRFIGFPSLKLDAYTFLCFKEQYYRIQASDERIS